MAAGQTEAVPGAGAVATAVQQTGKARVIVTLAGGAGLNGRGLASARQRLESVMRRAGVPGVTALG
jgi:hypothetical protein